MPASVVDQLLEDLSQIGAAVRDTGVCGRYHTALHKGIPANILKILQGNFCSTLNGHSLVRSNTDAHLFSGGEITLLALKCILEERADWYSTISTASSALNPVSGKCSILSIGADAVPQSVSRSFSIAKVTMIADRDIYPEKSTPVPDATVSVQGYPKDSIAIIGMSCRFPGAESIDEFWDLLTEGKSMLSEAPALRFGRDRSARSKSSLRYWGNFLRDIKAFDHRFFGKSAREAESMDPQQRVLLEIAYEALESSGYFADSSKPQDVGCYIGACATDYDFNVASHPPTAFSAIGTLRSFLSGKLSHHFGWSGPSIVLDTACSSSAVAIHTACTALRTGQCSQALAGGITLMTSPYLFENFATAHFLSPTGGSKPFSADADGYCRGEGGGLVVLKRLPDALNDRNHILGVIASSAVNQNDNSVSITVPHTSSQSDLYRRVAAEAGVLPSKVTFVEAHGTGTPVGDPIEMESIRRIFGGPNRASPLIVSSAKGNIGHLEGASGVAGLIKTILQMEHRLAPRQALFKTLNPKIPALEPDNICIPRSNLALPRELLVACVNNYGAAGSNAAMIVLEPPANGVTHDSNFEITTSSPNKYPIMLAAASEKSLLTYCGALGRFCDQLRHNQNFMKKSPTLSNLAFSLATRLNRELSFTFTTTATALDEVQAQLLQQTVTSNGIKQRPKTPPLVLCFGGQVSDRVTLDKRLWQGCSLLRHYMDICHNNLCAMGYPGIYPGIFQTGPVTDVVVLHSIIFATQYSCAQAWLESGLKADALIGYSFGELTALCISGILSLRDALKLVAGRASLMQKYWGPESGTMIAVETDLQTLEEIEKALSASNANYCFEIACFNGPTWHVIVSNKASAVELERIFAGRAIRYKRLDVPYGFHSRFTETFLPQLENLASSLTFHESKIPLETCTDTISWTKPTAKIIAAHTREPVFFGQAIQRLQSKLGPSTWLEAGSDSSIVNMVRRSLGQSSAGVNNFVPLQLNKPNSSELVIDATVALWNNGHQLQYWNFHGLQSRQYDRLRLPSYTWEKSEHWQELDMSIAINSNSKSSVSLLVDSVTTVELPPVLIRLESTDSRGHNFIINSSSEEYQTVVKDVQSIGIKVCPSAFYVELVSRACKMVDEDKGNDSFSVHGVHVYSPLSSSTYNISLNLERVAQGWRFKLASTAGSSNSSTSEEMVCHAEGTVNMNTASSTLQEEFCRYERLIGYDKIAAIENDPRSESLRGNVIYKMLAHAATYPDWYHGVKSMAVVDSRIVAKVTCPGAIPDIVSKDLITPLPILESFLQVASLHANCLHESPGGEVFQFTKADRLQCAPGFDFPDCGVSAEASWDVVAYASANSRELVYDMFIYDALTARLVLFMTGVHFTDNSQPITTILKPAQHVPPPANVTTEMAEIGPTSQLLAESEPQSHTRKQGKDAKTIIYDDICGLLDELAGITKEEVRGNASFADLGLDSLLMIEVTSELSTLLRVDLPNDELMELTDIDSLVNYLHLKCYVGNSSAEDGDKSSSPSFSQAPSTVASSLVDSFMDTPVTTPGKPLDMGQYGIQEAFDRVRFGFEKYAEQTGAKGFWATVYPHQADLVCAYVVDAYRKSGCDLTNFAAGQQIPLISTLPRHKQLVAQLQNVLVDSGLLEFRANQVYTRTAKPVDSTPATIKHDRMLQRHPFHASETKLLNVTGPYLADCLAGKMEPLSLLFGNKHNRELLADFYANSQFCKTATRLLTEFVSSVFSARKSDGTLCILEVGAGTGGTTKCLVEFLTNCGVSFEYTFTDISQSLVSQAKKNFSNFPQMVFMTFDCDQPAPQELFQKFHIVISTNCIHATSNITKSTANILPTLREDGVLCLVEFTKNLYWFDLVFGLLEGWWLFSDGRQHALADELFWRDSLRASGFKHVSWTDGKTEEAKTLRLICAFMSEAKGHRNSAPSGGILTKRFGLPMEEIVWKRVGTLELAADIYFPKSPDPPGRKRAIGMINRPYIVTCG